MNTNNSFPISKIRTKFIIKTSTIEWFLIAILFIFSFLNLYTLLISLILLPIFLLQKEIGVVKILNIVTMRTIINPGLAVGIENLQNLKWLILMGSSLYLIYNYKSMPELKRRKVRTIIHLILLFTIYNIVTSLLFSSLPTVSIFKVVSYSLVFLGVIIGVGLSFDRFDWIDWMIKTFGMIIGASFIFLRMPVSYMLNGVSFQGITNQPNMFGITAVIFIALLLSSMQTNKNYSRVFRILVLVATLYMIILSRSRTSLIGSIVLLFLYLLLYKGKGIVKVLVSFSPLIIIWYSLRDSPLKDYIIEFFNKGQKTGNILYSRADQIGDVMSIFKSNPLFGRGFAVPVLPYRSFAFGLEHIVEPGNLIIATLSYSGIIGFIIFMLYMFKIFLSNRINFKEVSFLPISAVIISMGEMVFFSTNNIGIWCYMMIALYIFYDNKDLKYSKKRI